MTFFLVLAEAKSHFNASNLFLIYRHRMPIPALPQFLSLPSVPEAGRTCGLAVAVSVTGLVWLIGAFRGKEEPSAEAKMTRLRANAPGSVGILLEKQKASSSSLKFLRR